MDEINLKVLDPVPHKQTLGLTNQFIYTSADEINKVAFLAEQELMKIDEHLEYIQNKVLLLEAKLASQQGPVQTESQPQPTAPQPPTDIQ